MFFYCCVVVLLSFIPLTH